MNTLPAPLQRLVEAFSRLPGVGERTALRYALFLVRQPEYAARDIGEAAGNLKRDLRLCGTCCHITDGEVCSICADGKRDAKSICVVEDAVDVFALEKAGTYRGRYHVLHGALNPLEGVTEEHLTVGRLVQRVEAERPEEVILATSVSLEGEATAMLLARRLAGSGVRLTRLGKGLPSGSELSFSDPLTLHAAMLTRTPFEV